MLLLGVGIGAGQVMTRREREVLAVFRVGHRRGGRLRDASTRRTVEGGATRPVTPPRNPKARRDPVPGVSDIHSPPPQRNTAAREFDLARQTFLVAFRRFTACPAISSTDALVEIEATAATMDGILAMQD